MELGLLHHCPYGGRMRNLLLKIVNPLLLILILFQFVTALMRGGIPVFFHNWHPVAGYVLVSLAMIHLVLNWGWVRGAYGGTPSGRDSGSED